MRKPVTAAVLALAALLSVSSVVVGHAELQNADPRDGETIATPYLATLWFDEELAPASSTAVVQDASGKQVASGAVTAADAKRMEINIPQLALGEYTVLWTAVTADDNGVTRGTYKFTVGAQATIEPPDATPAASAGATPAPSATSGSNTGSGNDLLLPLAVVVIVVAAIAGYLIYRNRRPGQPA